MRLGLLASLIPLLVSSSGDRGVVIEVDRAHFRLEAIDLAYGLSGPIIEVSLGSPTYPTPRGEYPIDRVVRNPGWTPGVAARAKGARPHPPSSDGPLGVAKIPLGKGLAIHGGAHRYALGTPVTLGCVGTRNVDLELLLDWLEARNALQPPERHQDGEIHQASARPVRVVVR